MAFRFFRRLKLAPGVTLNLTKRGGSLSFGPRGAKLTAGTSGVRRTLGVPGTGLWYTEHAGAKRGRGTGRSRGSANRSPPTPTVRPRDRLKLGFFKRLFTPQEEKNFVDGMRELALGNAEKAYPLLVKAAHLPDAAFMDGMQALKTGRLDEAEEHLCRAGRKHAGLGRLFEKYGLALAISLPVTERISAQTGPSLRGIHLALAEIHQAQGRWQEAVRNLRKLHKNNPADPVVTLSLCELLVEESGTEQACREVVELTKTVDNESEIHAALLLWKGKALRLLDLPTAARDTLTAAFRRKKDRSDDLLHAIQYERILTYEALGANSRARQELEKLYAAAPDYQDVAARLGVAG